MARRAQLCALLGVQRCTALGTSVLAHARRCSPIVAAPRPTFAHCSTSSVGRRFLADARRCSPEAES
eukprot:1567661-Lingulodinium_polyedra.AAC.1